MLSLLRIAKFYSVLDWPMIHNLIPAATSNRKKKPFLYCFWRMLSRTYEFLPNWMFHKQAWPHLYVQSRKILYHFPKTLTSFMDGSLFTWCRSLDRKWVGSCPGARLDVQDVNVGQAWNSGRVSTFLKKGIIFINLSYKIFIFLILSFQVKYLILEIKYLFEKWLFFGP